MYDQQVTTFTNIDTEIPVQFHKTLRRVYHVFLIYILALGLNLISSFCYVFSFDYGFKLLFSALIQIAIFVPFAFFTWFKGIFKAFRKESKSHVVIFSFASYFNLLFCISQAIGIGGYSSGWLTFFDAIWISPGWGCLLLLLCAFTFTCSAFGMVFSLIQVPTYYDEVQKETADFNLEMVRKRDEDELINPDPELLFSISKINTLNALYKMCSSSRSTRKSVYELSRPGGFARNWEYLYRITFFYIKYVSKLLELATPQTARRHQSEGELSSGTISSPATSPRSVFASKQAFFVPPTMRKRPVRSTLSTAGGKALSSQDDFITTNLRLRVFRLVCNFFGFADTWSSLTAGFSFQQIWNLSPSGPSQTISNEQRAATVYSIRSLAAVIVNSIEEDKFGLIQKNLGDMLKSLIQFSDIVDVFLRSNQLTRKQFEYNVIILDEEIVLALGQIARKLDDKISLLTLDNNELELIQKCAS